MAIYNKVNNSWVQTLKSISHNTWLTQYTRKTILSTIERGISEDEAEKLCNRYNREIESGIGLWQVYQ